jgi:hypothetical protein
MQAANVVNITKFIRHHFNLQKTKKQIIREAYITSKLQEASSATRDHIILILCNLQVSCPTSIHGSSTIGIGLFFLSLYLERPHFLLIIYNNLDTKRSKFTYKHSNICLHLISLPAPTPSFSISSSFIILGLQETGKIINNTLFITIGNTHTYIYCGSPLLSSFFSRLLYAILYLLFKTFINTMPYAASLTHITIKVYTFLSLSPSLFYCTS